MPALNQFLVSRIEKARSLGIYRRLPVNDPALEDFVSNDYLGLARSEELRDLIALRHEHYNGATGSRLLSGNSIEVENLESRLARIFHGTSALLFNSGYNANLSVLSSLPQKGDTIIYDELVHASIKDGMRLSHAKRYAFRHNDVEDMRRKIRKVGAGNVFVVVESIYSMDGDCSNLFQVVNVAKETGAYIILDEAHSTGILGDKGAGLAVSQNLHSEIDVRIYTFGKAMGTHGACVVGTSELKEFFVNFARPFIYTTALTPHSVLSITSAFDYLGQHPELQKELQHNVETYAKHIFVEGVFANESPIQTVLINGNERVRRAATQLQQAGFDVRPIVSPTVPVGKERLRICLHTFNREEKIRDLASFLNGIKEYKSEK